MKNEVIMTEKKWKEYVFCTETCAFNMFDPRARELTNLTKDEWIYIISNYGELAEKYKEVA